MFFFSFLIGLILVPSFAYAWGPLTHIYLGNELFTYAPLIPAGIAALLKKYKQDFLYGNLMADMILGKKYLPDDKSSHNWDVAMNLLEQAKKGPEKAFAYGYLSHLAADTVAHETLTGNKLDMEHTWIELKADSMINKVYWLQSVTISKTVQRRNDSFLEGSLDSYIFSFNTNKRIYKGIVFLSFLNKKRTRGVDSEYIYKLHGKSLTRMIDLLKNGKDSSVLEKSPL
ncbi:MAG: zinc dependent phospholipase C family protein [Nitrospirae bacterium]|nr:zinc dependent phospholipase C family protein [Nitrospirota bacterium]MCL5238609.1 zinc dependent phospholipase C family protein [Nitrospirota bacterium]